MIKKVRSNYFEKMNICSEKALCSLYGVYHVVGFILSVLTLLLLLLLLLLHNYQIARLSVCLINFRYYCSQWIPYFIGLDLN